MPSLTARLYRIQRTWTVPDLTGNRQGDVWRNAAPLSVDYFCPESSSHRPVTGCKLLYDQAALYGLFRVEDRYVRAVSTAFQSDVYLDSCVELFLEPVSGGGYFNFEFNCAGALLASYVTDPTRVNGRVASCVALSPEDDAAIARVSSLPGVIDPEISAPTAWSLAFALPFSILKKYSPRASAAPGSVWRGNFYKCGDATSHPHWASWSPLTERNFHLPECFGKLIFQ
ncbi:MAG TPA: carbohydrate-binding family 9-like protein [Smithellaceae bacterium]|nr:carbohydrate-binding family 9-like protein [Smithellaceae bacterium]